MFPCIPCCVCRCDRSHSWAHIAFLVSQLQTRSVHLLSCDMHAHTRSSSLSCLVLSADIVHALLHACRQQERNGRPTRGKNGVLAAILRDMKTNNEHSYFQCNLKLAPAAMRTPEAQMLEACRQSFATLGQEWWSAAEANCIADVSQATLLLFGKADSFTGFHVDWTEAKNIAFATQKVSQSGSLPLTSLALHHRQATLWSGVFNLPNRLAPYCQH